MKTNKNDHWKELYERASEKAKCGALLREHELDRDSIESWHFACELGIKAAIHKQGSYPAATHNLKKLIMGKYRGKRELYLALISNEPVNRAFADIYSVWTVDMRYNIVNLDRTDVDHIVRCYGAVFKWLEKNFLNQ